MRLAVLVGSTSPLAGGLYESVRWQTIHTAKTEDQIHVLTHRDVLTDATLDEWSPLRPEVFAARFPSVLGRSPELYKRLEELQPDLVHVHGIWLYLSAYSDRWARKNNKPYIVSPRGMLDPWAVNRSRWKKKFAWWLYESRHLSHASAIHGLTMEGLRHVRQMGLKNPVAVIPNGVTIPKNHCGPEAAKWPTQISNRRILLFLGRLHPKKGLTEFLVTWKKMHHRLKDWVLAVVGWSEIGYQDLLLQQIQQLGLVNDVFLLGPKVGAEKQAYLSNADGFVLPSHGEGMPMAVLEAWACGLPVLMTKECNIPEGFENKAAVQLTHGRLEEGLEQFTRMSESDHQVMGARGLELVSNRFNWKTVGRQTRELYDWVLGKSNRPSFVYD